MQFCKLLCVRCAQSAVWCVRCVRLLPCLGRVTEEVGSTLLHRAQLAVLAVERPVATPRAS